MTAPDARHSDELREAVAEALRQHVPLTSWQRDVRAYALTPGEAQAVADALLPVVTAWHEKAAEAQARARAAEELESAAAVHWADRIAWAEVRLDLRRRADALAADDRTDPA